MKFKCITAIAFTAMAILSCSEDTEGIGQSLTDETDKLEITTGVFSATSRSIQVDSVFSKHFDCYFGKVKDPETGAYVKSEFMTQFNILEDMVMPDRSKILGSYDGDIAADSCEIWLIFDRSKCYGDSLTPMKINIKELSKPMSDAKTYYSNFDPISEGYIREDGLKKSMAFSLANLTVKDSLRNTNGYTDYSIVGLNDPYTDKSGKTYNNYGTYVLRSYYDHHEYFKNVYTFVNNVCPGFYFEVNDGLGVMAKISEIDINMYFHYQADTTVHYGSLFLSSTPEVLRTTRVVNDNAALQRLVNDKSCTYLKAPAGIFTEVTLPVDEISQAHTKDSLLSVSINFNRQNSNISTQYPLNTPDYILMVQKDSLNTFFETQTIYNYTSSYMAGLSANAYSFSNIGNLITLMAKNKAEGLKSDPNWVAKHPDWNKAVLVPLAASITYDVYKTPTVTAIANQMGLSSTKLVGGDGNPIEMKVIYARFKEK